ncbi:hypothetical protein [Longimycelium tulufanense]|uniref:hypothetical protein n=1 Tax=Longimycelium tulufanense TaxID=907463 RepID=UPI001662CA66|nr:hypothetical protein [Longimycelium tulufanense]
MEDFVHPGAERILTERGITLLKGDGNMMMVECGPSGLIQVRSGEKGLICFKATPALPDNNATTGASTSTLRPPPRPEAWLKMRIPDVYIIKGDDNEVWATMTSNGKKETYDIERNGWTPVGEGAGKDPAALLEIRVVTPWSN